MQLDKSLTWYTAGPMTGLPQFNYPFFMKVAKTLRKHGYTIVSPAELDDPETQKAALASATGAMGTGSANGETWADFLSRDVKLIGDKIGGIIVLPGWEKSRGARLEVFVGLLCGLKFAIWMGNLELCVPCDPNIIRAIIRQNMP